MNRVTRAIGVAAFALACLATGSARAQPVEPLWTLARAQERPVLDSLRDLTAIESGSGDREGLDRISQLISDRLAALGAEVRFIEPDESLYRMHDTPARVGRMVQGVFRGTGARKILLIAHMDTVYLKGMGAKQPFRVDGNRAYGLGIADDKSGIAVILHTLGLLKAIDFREFGQITVLINGDEEISSPAARALFAQPPLIPGTKLAMNFERRRPPLEFRPTQAAVGTLAQSVYREIGRELKVVNRVEGGGTDAAFAALNTSNPVLERFGLLGFGAHSNDDEYVLVDSIAPRLYLAARVIIEFSRGRP